MEGVPEGERLLGITTEKNHKYIIIKITDRGRGISREEKENLFSLGYTTKDKGHGFGLYSCMLYIEEMKGELNVLSPGPNRGAEFRINLPCRE